MHSASPILVAIVGGSGAGKSQLAGQLADLLGAEAARLSLDDFYRDQSHLPAGRRAKLNFDHPRAVDWPSVERVLGDWLAGLPALVPRYDFATHCRRGFRMVQPKPIVLVDGLWLLLRPSLRRLFRLRIFLNCPARIRLARRLARDVEARGRTRASVLEQFRDAVQPMHRRFVAPQARWADVVLKGNWDDREVERLVRRIRDQR